MAVSWSFALLLVLTLVALITFSQPLFQSTPGKPCSLYRLLIMVMKSLAAFSQFSVV